MAPEDMRDDLIENEPTACLDETSADEKTWSWLVLYCFLISRRAESNENCGSVSLSIFVFSGGTHSEPSAITTRGSVSVRELTARQQIKALQVSFFFPY